MLHAGVLLGLFFYRDDGGDTLTSVDFQVTTRRYIVTVAVKLNLSPCSLNGGKIVSLPFWQNSSHSNSTPYHWVGARSPGGSGKGRNLFYCYKSRLGCPAHKLTSYFTNHLSRSWTSPYIFPQLTLRTESSRSCQSLRCPRRAPSLMKAKCSSL